MNRALCALLLTLCACAAPEPEEAQASFFAMNTYMTMTAHGANAQAAVDRAQARIEALESLWSVTQEGSDIYAVNHAQGQPVAVHEETAALLSFALDMAEETGGALEPTLYPVLAAWGFTADAHRVPGEAELAALLENVDYARVRVQGETVQLDPGMMLDLGAVGKGYAGDLAAQALREGGVESALLNLGGNVQAIGARPDGSPWRLELRNPFGEGGLGPSSRRTARSSRPGTTKTTLSQRMERSTGTSSTPKRAARRTAAWPPSRSWRRRGGWATRSPRRCSSWARSGRRRSGGSGAAST